MSEGVTQDNFLRTITKEDQLLIVTTDDESKLVDSLTHNCQSRVMWLPKDYSSSKQNEETFVFFDQTTVDTDDHRLIFLSDERFTIHRAVLLCFINFMNACENSGAFCRTKKSGFDKISLYSK